MPETQSVTPEIAQVAIGRVLAVLPEGWRVMPIGGTLLPLLRLPHPTTTKDVDLVILALDGETFRTPGIEDLTRLARLLAPDERIKVRSDHDALEFGLEIPTGFVKVEFVRGRKSKGGYFIRRGILESAAKLATDDRHLLILPPEALAFLKAWAAHDQEKLIAAGKDKAGFHSRRLEQFETDVRNIYQDILGRQQVPGLRTLETLLEACGRDRRTAVTRILNEGGWKV